MQRIALINEFSTEYTTAHYYKEAIENSGIECLTYKPAQQGSIRREIDLKLFIDDGTHYVIQPDSGVLKALYIIDTHMDFDLDTFLFRFADHVFCAQRNVVEKIERYCPNVSWLPLSCDPAFHFCEYPSTLFDIGFVGGVNDGKREEYLQVIKEKYGRTSYIGRAAKAEIGKIYSGSKIVFNVSVNNDINMRFFEALCSGALLVTEKISSNGMEELLEGQKEPVCVFYETIEEATSLIDYYLLHENERAEIARRGREFSFQHTYFLRFQKMLEILRKAKIRRHTPFSFQCARKQLVRAERAKRNR